MPARSSTYLPPDNPSAQQKTGKLLFENKPVRISKKKGSSKSCFPGGMLKKSYFLRTEPPPPEDRPEDEPELRPEDELPELRPLEEDPLETEPLELFPLLEDEPRETVPLELRPLLEDEPRETVPLELRPLPEDEEPLELPERRRYTLPRTEPEDVLSRVMEREEG